MVSANYECDWVSKYETNAKTIREKEKEKKKKREKIKGLLKKI